MLTWPHHGGGTARRQSSGDVLGAKGGCKQAAAVRGRVRFWCAAPCSSPPLRFSRRRFRLSVPGCTVPDAE